MLRRRVNERTRLAFAMDVLAIVAGTRFKALAAINHYRRPR